MKAFSVGAQMGFVKGAKGSRCRASVVALVALSIFVASERANAQADPTIKVSVPAGSLEKGLLTLGRQTGLQLLYSTSVAAKKKTPGLKGEMSAADAINAILADTGLQAQFTSDNTVRIFDPSVLQAHGQATQLDTISVEAEAARAAGGTQRESVTGPVRGFVATQTATATKTSTPIVEVPQSISVVPQTQIQAQGAQSITQALRYTAGVNTETVGAASPTSTFLRVRGFVPDLYLDGTRLPAFPSGAAYPEVEPYNVERIEVLKGPSSGLYGSSGPGGIVAMTSKRPLDTPYREVAVQTGSFNRKQVQFDFSDRFNGNENALFRIVGLFRDADHQIDYFQDNRNFIAPSFTLKNDSTKLTLLASYFQQDQRFSLFNFLPASGTVLPNPNGRISMHRYNGDPSYDNYKREQISIGYAFEHQFNDAWAFRQNVRYITINNDTSATAMARQGVTATSNDPRTGLLFGDPTLQNTRRGYIYTGADSKTFTIDNNVEGKFRTGAFSHTIVAGFDYRNLESFYKYNVSTTSSTLNLYNPVYGGAAIATPSIFFNYDEYSLKQAGLYIQDQIKFNNFILTLGGRHDWTTSQTDNRLNAAPWFGPKDTAFTGRAGLGYEFGNGVVPYVSYATSFDPVVGAGVGGVPFKPTTGEQYEVGVKWQPPGTKTLVTAAAFDLTQRNVTTRDPMNAGFSVQTGEVHMRGFEFEARAEVLPRLDIIAAYTFLDSEITKSNIPGEVGQRLNYTPEHQVSLWAQYGLSGPYLDGLTVGGGMRYAGETKAFVAGATYGAPVGFLPAFVLTTPSYTLFDAMVSYDLAYLSPQLKGALLRINATNIFDTYYISGCSSVIQCYQGNSRTVLATLAYKW